MKSKIKIIFFALILVGIIVVVTLFLLGYFKPTKAGLLIETVPESIVYINGDEVGKTKFDQTFKEGELEIKLVPVSDKPLMPYETRVELESGVKTIVQRNFGETEDQSSGAIISFERNNTEASEVSIVSIPDTASVAIDGQIRGNTPFKTDAISEGEHNLRISSVGYNDKDINVKIFKGYRLTAVFKLTPKSQDITNDVVVTPSPKPEGVKMARIKDTSTGFLRVRKEPSTLSEELFQVKPDEEYPVEDIDEETKWVKIEYQEGKTGYVSDQYVEIFFKQDDKSEFPKPSSTPSPTPTP